MTDDYAPFGEALPDLKPDRLSFEISKKVLSACQISNEFDVIELRRLTHGDETADIIIVDCINAGVPSHNEVGIKVRERLALAFTAHKMPEVKALRIDFPAVLHLIAGKPPSLCVYLESWEIAERSWTPQKHLQRILWWLSETAKGTLHPADQPVDNVFYTGAIELVIPPDFDSKINDKDFIFVLFKIECAPNAFNTIKGQFFRKNQRHPPLHVIPLFFPTPPIVHNSPEFPAITLGELEKKLKNRGADFIKQLREVISKKAADGVSRTAGEQCLIILQIPIKRSHDSDIERFEHNAFLIAQDLASFGEATGALFNSQSTSKDKKSASKEQYFPLTMLSNEPPVNSDKWESIDLIPLDVKSAITKEGASQISGVELDQSNFKAVIAGVGSLGSSLANLWGKEGWGEWTYIDKDHIKTHNIPRHLALDLHVGLYKATAVSDMITGNYYPEHYKANAIIASILDDNADIKKALDTASLLVDATTTLGVPRELSQIDHLCRSASVFLSPSGLNSVLLFEDSERALRLDSLEAQYYRAIISSSWGESHLSEHYGNMWVGAGCRDITVIISYEMIQLHSATIAKQLRISTNNPNARIRVWSSNSDIGELAALDLPVHPEIRHPGKKWSIVWDQEISDKLTQIRANHLPKETGGIIIGYIDHKLHNIYIVDILPAPPDSKADEQGFTRGIEGVESTLADIRKRTANIVDYIGEWHSHPDGVSANPSGMDYILLNALAETLMQDGHPALMMIVAKEGISLIVKDDE